MNIVDAIKTVLNTQYKYEVPEAFKAVADAGYEVYKSDGRWVVRNPATRRTITLNYRGRAVLYTKQADLEKVDIINYLNKPYNTAKEERYYAPSRNKCDEIAWAKHWAHVKEEKIARLEKEMQIAREELVRANVELAKCRIYYGLIK